MSKKISVLFLLGIIITSIGFSHITDARGVAIGSRSDEVKAIQEILKEDSDIYPEGYVTGYYGPLTEKAIKKLQKRCGLPETGELDDATEKCIYPINYKVTVVSPNGGEVWDRNTIQTIKWDVTEPEVSIQGLKPFWPKASIDLFKRVPAVCPTCPAGAQCAPCLAEQSVFVKHIATVNLFDKSYSWRVASDIPNRNDYVIRVSVGKNIASLWMWEKNQVIQPSSTEIWPPGPIPPVGGISWDESDRFFEITGETGIVCPPCPVCPDNKKLEQVIAILENVIKELQKAVSLLK
jgi:peptidoglycan hydrolase-like protein with peptidoglycan-binding domain